MAKFYTPSKLSENIRETPEGFLFCLDVPIARTGYQIYGEGETPLETEDGQVEIYRSSEEVFRPQTIASAQGKAVTITHPEEFVSPDNWKVLAKGAAHNVRKGKETDDDGEEMLLADLLITDAQAIALVKAGLREVSCGYEAEYEQTGKGRGRQINIVINHVALVESARAGETYAINDSKGKDSMDKVIERLKKKLGAKVVDEAMKEEKSKDEDKKDDKVVDKDMYDELVKMVKDLQVASQRIEGFVKNDKAKDEDEEEESKDEDKKEEKEEKSKDDAEEKESEDEDEDAEILERVKALEAAVAKLLPKDEDKKEEKSEDEDEEESEDGEESDDDDEDPTMTGDSARAEILSPGVGKTAKKSELRKDALVGAYGTKDGKTVLESLTGGKKQWADALKSKEKIDTLFIAASEVLKARRGTGLEKTKDGSKFEVGDNKNEPISAQKLNEMNAAHYADKK